MWKEIYDCNRDKAFAHSQYQFERGQKSILKIDVLE